MTIFGLLNTKTMHAKGINTVIFDLGGVLIDWNPRHLFRKIFEDENEMEQFLSTVCTTEWNEQQDAGRTWKEAVSVLLPEHPSYEREIRAYAERWPEMLNGPISGTVRILKRLREKNQHRLLALTNWSAETFPIARNRYEFLQWFEGILVSGEEKIKKPDHQIFHLIVDRYAIDPGKAVFIDDSLKNVKAAEEVGIRAIHFRTPQLLQEELQELGVLP